MEAEVLIAGLPGKFQVCPDFEFLFGCGLEFCVLNLSVGFGPFTLFSPKWFFLLYIKLPPGIFFCLFVFFFLLHGILVHVILVDFSTHFCWVGVWNCWAVYLFKKEKSHLNSEQSHLSSPLLYPQSLSKVGTQ